MLLQLKMFFFIKRFPAKMKKEGTPWVGVGLLIILQLNKICWYSIIHFGFFTRVVLCRFWVLN